MTLLMMQLLRGWLLSRMSRLLGVDFTLMKSDDGTLKGIEFLLKLYNFHQGCCCSESLLLISMV